MKNLYLSLFFTTVIALFFASCSKDPVNYGNTPTPVNSSDTSSSAGVYYFRGNVNGKAIDLEVNDQIDGYFEGTVSFLNPLNNNISGSMTAVIANITNDGTGFGVEFKTFVTSMSVESAYFNSFVNTGLWAFAPDFSLNDGDKLLTINYSDAAGNQYNSQGDQTGSMVKILSVTELPKKGTWNQSLKIHLVFNCKLYPTSGTGDPILLTGGDATVRLEDQLGN